MFNIVKTKKACNTNRKKDRMNRKKLLKIEKE